MQDQTLWILIGAVVVLGLLFWLIARRKNSAALRERYGEEYDRTVEARGGVGKAERDLEERERRVKQLDIRPLGPKERSEFIEEWREVKAVFVDSPVEAVHHADRLLAKIMTARGFPMADFDRRYEDLTVDHGEVARHYREGHDVVLRHGRGEASTEDLRQAMIHFEALFDDLVNEVTGVDKTRPVTRPATTKAD
jgi:LPXTG-motif cell wall-anchored protein